MDDPVWDPTVFTLAARLAGRQALDRNDWE
jgi:hypothetical protein